MPDHCHRGTATGLRSDGAVAAGQLGKWRLTLSLVVSTLISSLRQLGESWWGRHQFRAFRGSAVGRRCPRRAVASGSDQPAQPKRAVCCSGGGIRAAAFVLGGLQGLGHRRGPRSWLDDTQLITAVSGGAYLAGSYAIVTHFTDPALLGELPAYAPGSPEDHRLRCHTRYLVEGPKIAALGVLSILWGLVMNLLPILAGLYVAATVLGWALGRGQVLTRTGPGWDVHYRGWPLVAVAVLAGLALVVIAVDRLVDVYRQPPPLQPPGARPAPPPEPAVDSWGGTEPAALPTPTALTTTAGVDPHPVVLHSIQRLTVALVLLGSAAAVLFLGLGVPGLLDAAGRMHAGTATGVGGSVQAGTLAGAAAALVALTKAAVGRVTPKTRAAPDGSIAAPSAAADRAGLVLRSLAAWAGSALVLLLALVALEVWTAGAAGGIDSRRWWGIGVAVVVCAGWVLVTDVNRNSLHPFYRQRLASAFAVSRTSDGARALERPYSEPSSFSSFADDAGVPELVVCATANCGSAEDVPTGRGSVPFTFSARYTGLSQYLTSAGEHVLSTPDGMLPTAEYERRAGRRLLTLPAAIAVSGAAVSPLMGRITRAPLRLLLAVANVRLGLWLPNPAVTSHPRWRRHPDEDDSVGRVRRVIRLIRWQAQQPGIPALLREMTGRTSLRGRWLYVTDGGHYENLGLVEALRRGATEVIAFDASNDPANSWRMFGEAVQTARTDLGVEIDLDPTTMAPVSGTAGAPTLVAEGGFSYPNGVRGRLWLCKLALPEKASWDVLAYAMQHHDFPLTSTLQQLYGDREFEAYRRLGELAAHAVLDLVPLDLPAPRPAPAPAPGSVTVLGPPPQD